MAIALLSSIYYCLLRKIVRRLAFPTDLELQVSLNAYATSRIISLLVVDNWARTGIVGIHYGFPAGRNGILERSTSACLCEESGHELMIYLHILTKNGAYGQET